jgi:hypothetical protein
MRSLSHQAMLLLRFRLNRFFYVTHYLMVGSVSNKVIE